MGTRKSAGLMLMLLAFTVAFIGWMVLTGGDKAASQIAAWLPQDWQASAWLESGMWALGAALVLAVLITAWQHISARMARQAPAAGFITRSDLRVNEQEELARLPAYRDALRELCLVKRPSAIQIVNHLLATGLSIGASDIHLAPSASGTRVTLRIHGLLYDLGNLPPNMHPAVVSRIKVVSDLAIFQKNKPQDGRIRLEDERYTARVSVLPTNHGEKVVMRLASQYGGLYDVDRLGMSAPMLSLYKALLNRNQGVIVLTGPTGSGKTTTMYASLQHIHATRGRSVNIVTLEDPIEFDFPTFSQTQIEVAAGLSFAIGLRSVLRQDPDVIMLGEIRDEETASNAMRAAMTGHLILTTVHADSAAGVFNRMIQIGIEPSHLASAICAVISQRLCQRLCPHCRQKAPITDTQRRQFEILGITQPPPGPFYTSTGCDQCLGMGFTGLTSLYEMMIVSNDVRDLITQQAPTHRIHAAATEKGMATLMIDGLDKARQGLVSLDEVLRVVSV